MMKRASAAIAAVAALAVSTSAIAAPVCLESYRIRNTTVVDPHTILFHMEDGTTWRNTMKSACPDLKWYGFVYVEHGPDEVCENMQPIRVIHTGETCLLGAFTRDAPSQPAPSHM
jgi:hypothetical protein